MKYRLYHAPVNIDQRAIHHLNTNHLPLATRQIIRQLIAQNADLWFKLGQARINGHPPFKISEPVFCNIKGGLRHAN